MGQNMADKSERAQKEEKILQFWKDNQIFQKSLEKKAPKGEFVFYDGPPFATGLPHYGHILPGTIKDVIPRYKTMRGYSVPRRWGWDCHGLPIENMVEKELGLETKKDIEKFGIGEFNKRARESVFKFEKEWKEIIPRTGRWIDMDHAYKTMDTSYTESVWWSFKNLFDKELVYQGFKVMHLCPHCETTLSNFEVNQGYKDITDISVYAKFELVDEPGTYLIAWTTTPWTLPGNVALAINPEIEYVKVRVGENLFILAKDRLSALKEEKFEIIETFVGKSLIGKKYKTLFDYYLKVGQVYGAEFVSAEEGTGIVHIAPAFGEDDYNLSLKEKLPFVQHVGTDGRFKPEVRDFAGLKAKPKEDHQSSDVKIIQYLAHNNLLFAKEKIIHSYPHCWRCDTPLLNYAASSWFVKVTEIKDKLVKNNKEVSWIPEDIRDGRFGKWLEGARDWAVSRSRYWGTPLPVWQNADGSKRLVMDSVETLKKHTKSNGNKFIFMRHGEAEHNVLGICNTDRTKAYHLTENGRAQVQDVAKKLEKVDAIYASPFMRTQETADLIAEITGFDKGKIQSDERLIEFGFGEFGDKPFSEYAAYEKEHVTSYDTKMPGGESYLDSKNRFGQFLYEIDSKHKNETILVVSHGIGIETVAAVIEGADLKRSKEIIDTIDVHPGRTFEFDFVPLPHNDRFELDLHRPYIDEVVLEKDGEEYRRVPEVFDTWYDSGSVQFASRGARDFRPADFIAEGLDQTRGWFYTMAVLSTALFGKPTYKQVIVNGLILAEDGKKMSKRLKNYPELTDVLDKYGADALRYYLMSSQAVRAEDLAFSEKGLDDVVKKIINRLENVVSFYELYTSETRGHRVSTHVLDKWIDAKLAKLIAEVTDGLENYEIDRASRPIADFIDDLSTWYLRRSRNRPEALIKLREILISLSKVMAPFTPFIAEEIYQKVRTESDPVSVHLDTWPEEKKSLFALFKSPDEKTLKNMAETRRLASLALEARSSANIKVRQPLRELRIKNKELSGEYLEIIREELNVKAVVVDENIVDEIKLDTTLTPELEEEGRVRDAIRAVQEWRKEQNLKPGEKAHYSVPADLEELFEKYREVIQKATNVEFN